MRNIWKDPNRPQTSNLSQSLYLARVFMAASRGCVTPAFKKYLKVTGYAFLNRACELACAPVHIRPVETSNGIDYAWYTYSPRAHRILPHKHDKSPEILYDYSTMSEIMLGYEREMTEDQARSKAMGW